MVGYPHEIKGEGIFAFVVLKEGGKDLDRQKMEKELKKLCKERIAGYAIPDYILVSIHHDESKILCYFNENYNLINPFFQFHDGLPKTR